MQSWSSQRPASAAGARTKPFAWRVPRASRLVADRDGILQLHYARAPELGPWLDRVAVRGEVVVQFWLKPGEAAVTLGKGEEREVERIPAQLRRFL